MNYATGMYSFGLGEYDRLLVHEDSDLEASGGGAMTEDFYFCTKDIDFGQWRDVTHMAFDTDTWNLRTQSYGSLRGVATDLAYDPITDKMFGCFSTDPEIGEDTGGFVFGTLDIANGNRFTIAKIETPWIALGCDRRGDLYAVDMLGRLWNADKITGHQSLLGNLGFTANRRSTGAFDTTTGIFYVAVTNSEGEGTPPNDITSLYAVDVATATAHKVYDFADGEALGGMFIEGPVAPDDAPAMPQNLTVDSSPGSLEGSVSFSIPSATFSGLPLSGRVSWTITANDLLFDSGTAAPGEAINADGNVGEDGYTDFAVRLSNSAGRSPKAKLRHWFGHDMPASPASVVISHDGESFHICWDAPTTSVNGQFWDPSQLQYMVTRLPQGVVAASGIATESCTDPVTEPGKYWYLVEILYRGQKGQGTLSQEFRLGSFDLPYSLDFTDDESFEDLVVIDANADNVRWYREEYWYCEARDEEIPVACYPYSSFNAADDWLVLPPLHLTAGAVYDLDFEVLSMSESVMERLEVKAGLQPSAAMMTMPLMAPKEYLIYDPVDEHLEFCVESDGNYFIGFHALSDSDGYSLGISRISVSRKEGSALPYIGNPEESAISFYSLQGIRLAEAPSKGPFIRVCEKGGMVMR